MQHESHSAVSFVSFFRSVPKADLHVHLNGAVPLDVLMKVIQHRGPAMLQSLLAKYANHEHLKPILHALSSSAVSLSDVQRIFEYNSFQGFLASWYFCDAFFVSLDDFTLMVKGVLSNLTSDNVRYVEVIVSIQEWLAKGLSLNDLVATLNSEAKEVESKDTSLIPPLKVRYLVDLVDIPGSIVSLERTLTLLDSILALNSPYVIGINYSHCSPCLSASELATVSSKATKAGLHVTVHAGELPHSAAGVREAVDIIHTERIGHGIASVEDHEISKLLKETGIPLEVCISSNLCTQAFASDRIHPIVDLLRKHNIVCTLNTDDPTFFRTSLSAEYALAHERYGLTLDELVQMLQQTWKSAFGLTQTERDFALQRIAQMYKQFRVADK